MNELLLGLLTKTLNMSEDDLKSIILKEGSEELREDALQKLLEKDADRVAGIKSKLKEDADNQYKRGQREIAEKFESDIRRVFGLTSELTGEDLLTEAKSTTGGSGSGEDLTDDKVKSHPLYIQLLNEKKKEIDTINADWEKKLSEKDNEFNTRVTKSNAVQRAIDKIKGKNPVLPEDHEKAQARLNVIGLELNKYSWKQNGDDLVPVDEKGQQLLDAHNNPITFDQIVGNIGETYFDFQEEDGSNSGGGTGNENEFNRKKWDSTKVPKTPEELQKAMESAKDADERLAISQAYMEAQEK